MYIVLDRTSAGVTFTAVSADGAESEPRRVGDVPVEVARLERGGRLPSFGDAGAAGPTTRPRWVWADTTDWYPELLRAGVRVERCVDLRLSHAILRSSSLTAGSALATRAADAWDAQTPSARPLAVGLFDLADEGTAADPLSEFRDQRSAVADSGEAARISLLLAAESAGALIAAEMKFAGLPWRRDVHAALLETLLGPQPREGERPAIMRQTLERVRTALNAPELNPDSPHDLVRALARAGIRATSTRSGELQSIDHPAIPPLLEYKKQARLLSANGWNWLDANVREGRFHPDYVPGGVVTGRWASTGGGGALQLPKQVRGAVIADPGWTLVVADAAQLEPRILSALAGDRAMADAGRHGDLYTGIVDSGAIATRAHAKVAMLGAMYGATSGEAGRLMPILARAYPKAIALVEEAARAGERGEVVTTRLGRSSPRGALPGFDETATEAEADRTRNQAKSWGRFTRNFVVQGTAAEWALCWMAGLRGRLHDLSHGAELASSAHLVFFLHDEVVVHTPKALVGTVVAAVKASAVDAGELLFGALPVEFPVTVAIVDDYGSAA